MGGWILLIQDDKVRLSGSRESLNKVEIIHVSFLLTLSFGGIVAQNTIILCVLKRFSFVSNPSCLYP